jgi:hypothetical protein
LRNGQASGKAVTIPVFTTGAGFPHPALAPPRPGRIGKKAQSPTHFASLSFVIGRFSRYSARKCLGGSPMFADRLFPTTVAGSLPKPGWLAEPEKLWAGWRADGEDLTQAQRDAALVWLKLQEDAGIDIVSDGEQFRIHFVHGFLQRIEGIDWQTKTRMGIRNNRYEVEVPTVTAPIVRPAPIHIDDMRFVRAHTKRRLKFTLPFFNRWMSISIAS